MEQRDKALEIPISEGKVRIQLSLDLMLCKITNSAEDFLNLKEDNPRVQFVSLAEEVSEQMEPQYLEVFVPEGASTDEEVRMGLKQASTWFDVNTDLVGEVWKSDFEFKVVSEYPKYLKYQIAKLNYTLQWLQKDPKNDEIRSVSISKKTFVPTPETEGAVYTLNDVAKVSDMLGRAIKKIDLRTGAAYVRFNDENGRLDPLIKVIAEKTGYHVIQVDKETARKLEIRGDRVSHIISLARNY